MTFYNYYVVLNFGFNLSGEQSFHLRAGTGQYREEHSNAGRLRFYHRGSPTSKSDHVIEIFIKNAFQWSFLKEHGLRKILINFTPGATSKFVIVAHGAVGGLVFGSEPQMPPTRKRHGRPMTLENAISFQIHIKDIAVFIAKSIKREIFRTPENFFAITLWSCNSGKSSRSLGNTMLPMAAVLLRELYQLCIYSRVRAPITELTVNSNAPEWNLPPAASPTSLPRSSAAASPYPLNLHALDTNLFYDRVKFSEVLHKEKLREDITDPDDIPESHLIYARAIMLLFMIRAPQAPSSAPPSLSGNITCCIPREKFPFHPTQNSLYDEDLLEFISFLTPVFQIILLSIHYSTVDKIPDPRRQQWLDGLREMQQRMWQMHEKPKVQRTMELINAAKIFINALLKDNLITAAVASNYIARLDGIEEDNMDIFGGDITESDDE